MSLKTYLRELPQLNIVPISPFPLRMNERLLEPLFLILLEKCSKAGLTMDNETIFKRVYQLVLSGKPAFNVWHALLAQNKMVLTMREKICVYFEGNVFFNFPVAENTNKCFYSLKYLSIKTQHLMLFYVVQPFFDYLYTKPLKTRSCLRSIQWMCLDSVPLKSLMMSLRTVRSLMTDINTIISCNFPSNRTPQIRLLAVNCVNMYQVKTMLSKIHFHSEFLQLNFPTFNWDQFRQFFDTNDTVYMRVTKLTISGEITTMQDYFVEFMTNMFKMFPKLRYLNFHFRIYNRTVQPLANYNVEHIINEFNSLALMVKHVTPEANMCFKFHRFDLFNIGDRNNILEYINRIENIIRYTTLCPIQDQRCFRMRSSVIIPPQTNDLGAFIRGKKLFYIVSLFEENSDFPSNVVNLFDEFEYIIDHDPPRSCKRGRRPAR